MADAAILQQKAVPGNSFFKPFRLAGALAADTTILDNITAKERVDVSGASKLLLAVRSKGTFLGTCTIDLHRMGADATLDDTDGADRLSVGNPTPATITGTNEDQEMTVDCEGVEYIDVEFVMSAGGSDEITLDYVDVFLTRA